MAKHLIRFDWAMKRLLRSKVNFGILEGFLSELLKRDLKILGLPEGESNKSDKDSKSNKVDILVELSGGEIVLIEVQTDTEHDFLHRMLFGTSKIVSEHLKEGEGYFHIKKIYSVNILYFNLGHGTDYIYHGTTSFIGIHNHDRLNLNEKQKELFKKEHPHEIYPEYYLIMADQFNDVARNTLDEWVYFLKNEEIKDSFHAKGLLEAKEKLSALKLNDAEKLDYDRYLDNLHHQASMVTTNYKSGEIDGLKKGLKKGLMKGKIEVARKMKAVNMNNETIQRLTGLSTKEIEKV